MHISYITLSFDHKLLQSRFVSFGTLGLLDSMLLCCGAVLCILGCLASDPGLSSLDAVVTTKCPQVLSNVL